ncbi:putative SnoaL-like aldol condensation-catalyzing enzyme [Mucilaginibacter frigoritolerans]|uniref:Putative SnoaL-like aldol condensation-catalyzing enzyme n=1 Tax=Mucilaginibacter frigoritolerans TaxID=652788 RepID=A0A562TRJ8_9SPHI|nr:ester cyclase [Mucilaginibacter frigoritolerans]TWI95858.1 putative SnoaL-like aldol condensation-catalyzing enzyme [Mucilaginibacter frigoritolerans]
MKRKLIFIGFTVFFAANSFAQSQKQMLYSNDPQLAKNKKIVYDFWRSVLEGGHLELAPQYMLETYIQHNPNVPTGRQGFIDFFSKFAKARPIVDTIQGPLIAIVAEGDRVVLSFKSIHPDPKDPTKKYTTTSFEMLRVENGKVAEHWDSALKE